MAAENLNSIIEEELQGLRLRREQERKSQSETRRKESPVGQKQAQPKLPVNLDAEDPALQRALLEQASKSRPKKKSTAREEVKVKEEEQAIIDLYRDLTSRPKDQENQKQLRSLPLDNLGNGDSEAFARKENTVLSFNFTLAKTHDNLRRRYGQEIDSDAKKRNTLHEMILDYMLAESSKIEAGAGKHGPLAETLLRCLLDMVSPANGRGQLPIRTVGLLDALLQYVLTGKSDFIVKLHSAWSDPRRGGTLDLLTKSLENLPKKNVLIQKRDSEVLSAIPCFIQYLMKEAPLLRANDKEALETLHAALLGYREAIKVLSDTNAQLHTLENKIKSMIAPLCEFLEDLSNKYGGQEAISLRGLLYYNHLTYNRVFSDALPIEARNVPEKVYLWWYAAKDVEIDTSTVDSRKKAHRVALEHSVRAWNRSNDAGIDDWCRFDDPACPLGAVPKLAECLKNTLQAFHPDNVFVLELNILVAEYLLNGSFIQDCFRKHTHAEQLLITESIDIVRALPTEPNALPKNADDKTKKEHPQKCNAWKQELASYFDEHRSSIMIFKNFKEEIRIAFWKVLQVKFGLSDASDKKDISALKKHIDLALKGLHWKDFDTISTPNKSHSAVKLMETADSTDADIKTDEELGRQFFASVEKADLQGLEACLKHKGFNINLLRSEHEKQTALHVAMKNAISIGGHHVAVLRWLLRNAASLEITDHLGHSPLHLAAFMKSLLPLEKLQDEYPKVLEYWHNHKNQDGKTPAEVYEDILLERDGRELLNELGSPEPNIQKIKALLEQCPNPQFRRKLANIKREDGQSVLHIAMAISNQPMTPHKNKGLVTLLIRNGADLRCFNNKGFTPLHQAALTGSKQVLDELEQIHDLDIWKDWYSLQAQDVHQTTPIQFFEREFLKRMAAELLKAVDSNQPEVVLQCFDACHKDADLREKLANQETARITDILTAKRSKARTQPISDEIRRILIEQGASLALISDKPICKAILQCDFKKVQEAALDNTLVNELFDNNLSQSKPPNAGANYKQTLLHEAMWQCGQKPTNDAIRIVMYLINMGAKINTPDNMSEMTPLHRLAQTASLATVQTLFRIEEIRVGWDTFRNCKGLTPKDIFDQRQKTAQPSRDMSNVLNNDVLNDVLSDLYDYIFEGEFEEVVRCFNEAYQKGFVPGELAKMPLPDFGGKTALHLAYMRFADAKANKSETDNFFNIIEYLQSIGANIAQSDKYKLNSLELYAAEKKRLSELSQVSSTPASSQLPTFRSSESSAWTPYRAAQAQKSQARSHSMSSLPNASSQGTASMSSLPSANSQGTASTSSLPNAPSLMALCATEESQLSITSTTSYSRSQNAERTVEAPSKRRHARQSTSGRTVIPN